jgi:photosystem II stability/assembly factor-like uncharacterized protein
MGGEKRFSAQLIVSLALVAVLSDGFARFRNIPVEALPRVVSAKLIAPGVGWVALMHDATCAPGNVFSPCPPMRLYWTDDNGQHWRNITPPDMPTRNIRQVFFLDRSHGWVASTDALGEETNAPFYLFSTEDAGKTWRTLILRRPMFKLMDDYTFPEELFFSDSQHGWMLWRWGMMNTRLSFLLVTIDGGRTWERLPDPPLGRSLEFTSPRDGWMIGTSQKDRGIPTPEDDAIWTTRDGGQHWQEISLPQSADLEGKEIYFSALKFRDRRNGLILGGTLLPADEKLSFFWATHDEGKTWRFSKLPEQAETTSILGTRLVRIVRDPVTDRPRIFKDNLMIAPDIPYSLPTGTWFVSLDFVDHSNAWLNVYFALLSTTDGGKSFHSILPSTHDPEWTQTERTEE